MSLNTAIGHVLKMRSGCLFSRIMGAALSGLAGGAAAGRSQPARGPPALGGVCRRLSAAAADPGGLVASRLRAGGLELGRHGAAGFLPALLVAAGRCGAG